jgi:ecdysteroid 25-hydroxylase CYP306A1
MNFLMEGKEKTHEYYETIILNHIQKRESFSKDEENVLLDDVINAFLDEKKRRAESDGGFYSTAQFHHLLADLFGAGLDTTLTTLSWFFVFLAEHTDVQVRSSVINTATPEPCHAYLRRALDAGGLQSELSN